MNIELKPNFPISGFGPCSQIALARTAHAVVTLRARHTDAGWEVKAHDVWRPVQATSGVMALLIAAAQLPVHVIELRY